MMVFFLVWEGFETPEKELPKELVGDCDGDRDALRTDMGPRSEVLKELTCLRLDGVDGLNLFSVAQLGVLLRRYPFPLPRVIADWLWRCRS